MVCSTLCIDLKVLNKELSFKPKLTGVSPMYSAVVINSVNVICSSVNKPVSGVRYVVNVVII